MKVFFKKVIDERKRLGYNGQGAYGNLNPHRMMLAQEGGKKMEIRVGENESLESALKRWKRKCARSGVLAEVRRREHYEKPSVKRKKKAEAARKRKY